jgi:F-type H+-transporting ATPase subunit a
LSANPLEQFEVKTIIPIEVNGIDISFTNSSLFMAVAVFLSTFLLLFFVLEKNK